MSKSEMIHQIKKNKGVVDQSGQIVKVIGYTSSNEIPRDKRGHLVFPGAQKINVEDEYCYAKELHIQQENDEVYIKHFIKIGLNGRVFDPWGMYSEGTQKDFAKRLGKPKWNFAECSKKCFDLYINFLQSRNPAWLKNAERELR
jgi:hypothetical protein